jgi:hypothetical protein
VTKLDAIDRDMHMAEADKKAAGLPPKLTDEVTWTNK